MPLPYHAGKSKLAKTISKMVYKKVEENPSIKNYAEPFSGMARVGIKVMEDDKNKTFKKYIFSDVNPTITVLFKALKKGWLPKLENITQKKWESYKKNKKPSAQKSFVGYTLGFGGQYFGGKQVRTEKRSHGGKNFAANYMKSKKKYLKGLQPYFKSSKFMYKEKSVFDLDYKDTIIYCDPPYVATAFRAKKIWDKEKEKKLWDTIKKWLEPSKNNIVILSNSKRTNKTKGLRVKKIYEDDVEYGSWKKNWKKRKEMIFEVVNTSGRKTRKKRGGTMNDKDRGDLIYIANTHKERLPPCYQPDNFPLIHFPTREYCFILYLKSDKGIREHLSKMEKESIDEIYKKNKAEINNKVDSPGCCTISGGKRRKKKTRKKRGGKPEIKIGDIWERNVTGETAFDYAIIHNIVKFGAKNRIYYRYNSDPSFPYKELDLILKLWEDDFRKTHFKYETTPPYSGDEQEGGKRRNKRGGVSKFEVGARWKPNTELPNRDTTLEILPWNKEDVISIRWTEDDLEQAGAEEIEATVEQFKSDGWLLLAVKQIATDTKEIVQSHKTLQQPSDLNMKGTYTGNLEHGGGKRRKRKTRKK
jgi:site-specific DNA-adenine methylase